jgi:hypothetical protein
VRRSHGGRERSFVVPGRASRALQERSPGEEVSEASQAFHAGTHASNASLQGTPPGRETWASTLDGRRDTAPGSTAAQDEGVRRIRAGALDRSPDERTLGVPCPRSRPRTERLRRPSRHPPPGDRSRKVLRSRRRTRRVRRSAAGNVRRRTTVPEWFPNGLPERASAGFLDQRFPGAPGGRAGRREPPDPNGPGATSSPRGKTELSLLGSTATSAQSGVPQTCPLTVRSPVSLQPAAPPPDSVALGSPHDA